MRRGRRRPKEPPPLRAFDSSSCAPVVRRRLVQLLCPVRHSRQYDTVVGLVQPAGKVPAGRFGAGTRTRTRRARVIVLVPRCCCCVIGHHVGPNRPRSGQSGGLLPVLVVLVVMMKLMLRRSAVRNSDIRLVPTRLIAHLGENEESHANTSQQSKHSRIKDESSSKNKLQSTAKIWERFGFVGAGFGRD